MEPVAFFHVVKVDWNFFIHEGSVNHINISVTYGNPNSLREGTETYVMIDW